MKEKENVVPINEDIIKEIVRRVLIECAKDDIEQKKAVNQMINCFQTM